MRERIIGTETGRGAKGRDKSRLAASAAAMLLAAVMILAMTAATAAAARERLPLSRDGWRHGAIFNGRQNMPVILPGIARDWAGGCAGGKAPDCRKLAVAFTEGSGDVRPNLRIAIGYWLAACNAADGAACGEATAIIRDGSAGYADLALALRTAQRGCEGPRDPEACALLGLAYHRGEGTVRDPARAASLWQAGCAAGGMEACRLHSEALRESGDTAASLALARRACEAGGMWGCGRMARAHRLGEGAPSDPATAARYALRGCTATQTADPEACAHHGHFLGQSGNPADIGKASMMLTRACMAGSAQGCFEAGELGRRNPPGSKLARWEVALSYRDGCDKGHAPSCRGLGELYLVGNGQVQRREDRAAALLDHACTIGDRPACDRLTALGSRTETARRPAWAVHPAKPASEQIAAALALIKAGRGQDGLEVIARLMEEGHADASWVLAGWLAYGEPGVIDAPNRAQAITLAENAANQGHFAAARWVGMAHWEGDGIPVNREKAKNWLRIAVDSGDPLDEALYRSMVANDARDKAEAELDRQLAANYRPRSFWGDVIAGLAATPITSSYAAPPSPSSGPWATYVAGASQRNFNSYIAYVTGATTACRSTYCR